MKRVLNGLASWLILSAFFIFIRAHAQKIVTYSDGPCCKAVWVNGQRFYIIRDDNVSVAVGPPQNFSARLHAVEVEVRQDGNTSVEVDPATFKAWAADDVKTPLPYVDMEGRAEHDRKHRSLMAGILNGVAAAGGGAAAATPQTATVNNSNGTSSTITYTDPDAVARTNETSATNARKTQEAINTRRDVTVAGLLQHNTLSRGQIVSDLVYFEGPKGMKPTKKGFTPMANVAIVLNGTTYVF